MTDRENGGRVTTMTEAEWLACTDPTPMLEYLQGKAGERKLRLFAAARCRLFRPDWNDWWPIREAVDAAEQFSDGLSPAGQLTQFHRTWEDFNGEVSLNTIDPHGGSTVLLPDRLGLLLVQIVSSPEAGSAARGVLYDDLQSYFIGTWKDGPREQRAECHLLREVFGNPFRPFTLSPAIRTWNDATVSRLAQAAYDERHLPAGTLDTNRLAVLADALEEAGCTSEEVLGHLRGPGPHVRGCWVVDPLLGKE
jgi:hypothetical protein